MNGCLDRISCDCDCDCLETLKEWLTPKRNMIASVIAGTLFAAGWWCAIDACAEHAEPLYASYFICGIFSTIALLMINSVSTGQLTGDSYTEGCLGRRAARAWLFVGFLFAFGGLIGALWIFIQQFLVPAVIHHSSTGNVTTIPSNVTTTLSATNGTTPAPTSSSSDDAHHIWQGVAFFLQNLFIFFSTLVFKFGRSEEEDPW